MTRVVVFDWQHEGKPGQDDVGAVHGKLREVDLTRRYIDRATEVLKAHGVRVVELVRDMGRDARYGARHEWVAKQANAWDRTAYVACHVNSSAAGTARYGMVGHDSLSRGGKALASALDKTLTPVVGDVRVEPVSAGGWTHNMYATIAGIYDGPATLSGVCLEPFFIQDPRAADLPEKVGEALALGLLDWLGVPRGE